MGLKISFLAFVTGMMMFAWATEAFADHPYEMPAGALIEVRAYDAKTRTFTVVSLTGCKDEHRTTMEELKHGILAIRHKPVHRKPASVVGQQFTADNTFMLLSPSQIEARRLNYKREQARR